LARFKQQFTSLRDLGKSLGLGRLEGAGEVLRNIGGEARNLVNWLKEVVTGGDKAHAALSRMGSAVHSWGAKTFGAASHIGTIGTVVSGASLLAPIERYAEFEDIARRSAITKGLSGSAATAETGRLMAFFRRDARENGQSSDSIAEAYLDLIQNNIAPALAEKLLPIHTRAATAYDIDPRLLGNVVQTLVNSFKIDDKGMGGALASMALASQSGKFGVADFSHFIPMMGGQMSLMGMTGRASFDTAAAALEIVTKNSTDPSGAAANFYDALRYILSPMAARAFQMKGKMVPPEVRQLMKQSEGLFGAAGIDLSGLLIKAEKEGINPLDAIIGKLSVLAKGKTPVEVGELFGALLHNQQAGIALASLVENKDQFLALRKRLGLADEGKLDRDAQTRMAGGAVQVKMIQENLDELGQTLGRGFLPILKVINGGLQGFLGWLDRLDAKMPGLEDRVLLVVGAVLAFSAVLGAIGVVGPLVAAGFSLLGGAVSLLWRGALLLWPVLQFVVGGLAAVLGVSAGVLVAIAAIAAVFVGAAVDIYEHWDRFAGFFEDMWRGVKDVFGGFLEFLQGIFTANMGEAWGGIKRIWSGLTEFFAGLWGTAKRLFLDFVGTLDGWTGGAIVATFNKIRDTLSSVIGKFHEWIEAAKSIDLGSRLGLSDKPAGAPASDAPAFGGGGFDPSGGSYLLPPSGNVHVSVGVDENGRLIVTRAQSDSKAVQVTAPNINPGQTLGRP
jgi:TP901 family phage tail tape measure protein